MTAGYYRATTHLQGTNLLLLSGIKCLDAA